MQTYIFNKDQFDLDKAALTFFAFASELRMPPNRRSPERIILKNEISAPRGIDGLGIVCEYHFIKQTEDNERTRYVLVRGTEDSEVPITSKLVIFND